MVVGPDPGGAAVVGGAQYVTHEARWKRLFETRLSQPYAAWITWRGARPPRRLVRVMREFQPEALLTISHAGSWLTAHRLAAQEGVPLLMVSHDDWAFSDHLPPWMRAWADRRFGLAYRAAAARFCISPAMAEEYERRYGVVAQVIYPIRDPSNPVFVDPSDRLRGERRSLVFAYAGSVHGERGIEQLFEFAAAAASHGHRLVAFSPQWREIAAHAARRGLWAEAREPVPSGELIRLLRREADCLLVTGSFEPSHRDVVRTLFPSKLADYTAVGVPILSWAPDYASVTRFARDHPGAFKVVTDVGRNSLLAGIESVAGSAENRVALALHAIEVGDTMFSARAGRGILERALVALGA